MTNPFRDQAKFMTASDQTVGELNEAQYKLYLDLREVIGTNLAKIDKETGKVRKREDGKVLKPVGWTPPNLEPYVKKI